MNSKKYTIFFLIITLIFTFTRVIYLDSDLPPYHKTLFGSKDEQVYNNLSFNLFHFNAIDNIVGKFGLKGSANVENQLNDFANNIYTYFGLLIFGNNYYGLRMPSVIISLIILIILITLLYKFLENNNFKDNIFLVLLFLIWLTFDFGFLTASRNAAPVIFRSFYLLLILLYVNYILKLKNSFLVLIHYFIIGYLSSFLVFFSYLTNSFYMLAIFLLIVYCGYYKREIKNTLKQILVYFSGILAGIFIADKIYEKYTDVNILDSLSIQIHVYSTRLGSNSNVYNLLIEGMTKFIGLVTSNLFTLNFTLFFFMLLFIQNSFHILYKRNKISNLHVILLMIIIAYFIQSLFYNPHSSKWIIILYPILFLYIFINFYNVKNKIEIVLNKYRYTYYILAIFTATVYFGNEVIQYLYHIKFNQVYDIELTIIRAVSFSIFLFFMFLTNKIRTEQTYKNKINWILLLALLPNMYLSIKYFYVSPKYNYRDTLMALSKKIGDDVIAGGWSDGFRLYGQGNTIFTWYQIQDIEKYRKGIAEIFDRDIAKYTIDYSKPDFINIKKDINLFNKNYSLEKDTTFYLGEGSYRDSLILYERTIK